MNFTLLQYYDRSNGDLSWLQIALIIFSVLAIASFIKGSAVINKVLSHWHQRFDEVPFSPKEFYEGVERAIKEREMTYVATCRFTYAQGGLLSPHREYLRIQYKTYLYDICAAPIAKGFFVSWWLGEKGDAIRDFFINLPVIGKLFKKREKTFFELDTEIMFKEMITASIKSTIEQLTKTKGIRQLTDADWKDYSHHY